MVLTRDQQQCVMVSLFIRLMPLMSGIKKTGSILAASGAGCAYTHEI